MITAVALCHAGPSAVLVARPGGVPHVYVGPLTRSGKGLPRSSRPVCRARTRRLTVLPHARTPGTARVCARCAVCLSSPGRQARTRDAYKARFSGLTGAQLTAALADARTPTEVDQVAHLTLLLYGVPGCRAPNPDTGRSLTDHVHHARTRYPTEADRAATQAWRDQVTEVARQRRTDLYEAREQRIARVGFVNATTPRK